MEFDQALAEARAVHLRELGTRDQTILRLERDNDTKAAAITGYQQQLAELHKRVHSLEEQLRTAGSSSLKADALKRAIMTAIEGQSSTGTRSAPSRNPFGDSREGLDSYSESLVGSVRGSNAVPQTSSFTAAPATPQAPASQRDAAASLLEQLLGVLRSAVAPAAVPAEPPAVSSAVHAFQESMQQAYTNLGAFQAAPVSSVPVSAVRASPAALGASLVQPTQEPRNDTQQERQPPSDAHTLPPHPHEALFRAQSRSRESARRSAAENESPRSLSYQQFKAEMRNSARVSTQPPSSPAGGASAPSPAPAPPARRFPQQPTPHPRAHAAPSSPVPPQTPQSPPAAAGTPSRSPSESTVDGRGFFRHARRALSPTAFTELLYHVKAYNSREQSRSSTLRHLHAMLVPQHRALYDEFYDMVHRNS